MNEIINAVREAVARTTGINIQSVIVGGQGRVAPASDLYATVTVKPSGTPFRPIKERQTVDGSEVEKLHYVCNSTVTVDIVAKNDIYREASRLALLVTRMHHNKDTNKLLKAAGVHMSRVGRVNTVPVINSAHDIASRYVLELSIRHTLPELAQPASTRLGKTVEIRNNES